MRLTEQAQQTLKLAQEEARNLNHNWIGTEHLLLGLVRHLYEEDSSHDLPEWREILPNVTPEAVRALVLRAVAPATTNAPEERHFGRESQFTARMNLVLESSWQISLELGNGRLGDEHLLLGALYERDGVAAQVLSELGVAYETVYELVATKHSAPFAENSDLLAALSPGSTRMTPRAVRMSEIARQQADGDELTAGMLDTHHYLLALVIEGASDPEHSLAAKVLDSFGITYGELEARINDLSVSNISDVPNWSTAHPRQDDTA